MLFRSPGFHEETYANLNSLFRIHDLKGLLRFILYNKNCTIDTIRHWDVQLSTLYKVIIDELISYGYYDSEDEIYEKFQF